MFDPNRRDFLKSSSAAVAAGTVLGTDARVTGAQPQRPTEAGIPPHRPLPLDEVHTYTNRLSVAAGETIDFHISSTYPYEFQVCRLGPDVESPSQDEVLQSWQVAEPVMQPIHPGSYIHVESSLPTNQDLHAVTLECWVRLWNVTGKQGVITQRDQTQSGGYGLHVREDRAVEFYLAGLQFGKETHSTRPGSLTGPGEKDDSDYFRISPAKQWHHLVATFDGTHKRIFIDGHRAGQWKITGRVKVPDAPLRIGADGRAGQADDFLDADIAMPAVYLRALSATEIKERFEAKALRPPAGDRLLACWPLAEEQGDHIADISGHERHGRLINHGTWMIGGPSFDANVGQFSTYDPNKDATRGHGLRLASDDLYDCRWQPTFQYRIPENAKSGAYVGRIRFQLDGESRLYHSLFVVKKSASAPRAPVAFLFSTNTWKAYSATPFSPTWPGFKASIGARGYWFDANDPKSPYCCYRHHRAGQPTYQMGMRMPWPTAGPYTLEGSPQSDFSHLCRADRFTETWLAREGYDYDAYSELDLHQDPHLLDGYQAVMIVGHSEYWSRKQYEHVRQYLESGGNVICLSGNTLYWRVSFDEDHLVMECRKADGWGAQLTPERRGECWHSHDRRRGGVPRDCGFPAWKLLGVEFLSFNSMKSAGAGPFRVSQAEHFLFQKPNRVNLKNGDRFGFDPDNPRRQAIGNESDVRVSTLMRLAAGPIPEDAPSGLMDPPGIDVLAEGVYDWKQLGRGGAFRDYYHRVLPPELSESHDVACEMIYWERDDGGRVFAAPSISAAWPLARDEHWSKLLKNVLDHFGVQPMRV